MAICIAALFHANYSDQTMGRVALVATDRLAPSGDGGREHEQIRAGIIGSRALVLAAGDLGAHTDALSGTQRELADRTEAAIEDVAAIYAAHVRKVRMRQAAQIYLSPLGLDEHSFLQNQKDMAQSLVATIVSQIQNHKLRNEAIVVGSDSSAAHLFHIDSEGIVSCRNEIGFLSVGHGRMHAESYLASSRYANHADLYGALLVAYVAKKRAEVAAGIESETNMFLISREGVEPIFPEMVSVLQEIYNAKVAARRVIDQAGIMRLVDCHRKFIQTALTKAVPRVTNATNTMRVSGNFQTTLPPLAKHHTWMHRVRDSRS